MATGRKTVVVGQVIDPVAWGNPVWDQSVQQFASDSDRTAQFPTAQRKAGAVTWLDDQQRLDVWDGAKWRSVSSPVANRFLLAGDFAESQGTGTETVKSPRAHLLLPAGTWLVEGAVSVTPQAQLDACACELWDVGGGMISRGPGHQMQALWGGTCFALPTVLTVNAGATRDVQVAAHPNGPSSMRLTLTAGGPAAYITAKWLGYPGETAQTLPGGD